MKKLKSFPHYCHELKTINILSKISMNNKRPSTSQYKGKTINRSKVSLNKNKKI